MKIGITGLVIPKSWDFPKTLEVIVSDGYEAFELALRDTGYFSLASSDEELDLVAQQAKAAGIDLVSVCPSVQDRPKDLMCADPALRAAGVETWKHFIRIAKRVGADTILVVLGALTPDLFYDVAYSNALESIKQLAPIAESAGIKLAIEYVWNKFLLSPVEFAGFCDDVGSPSVGFYFDPGNMAIFGYPEQWVRICGRHLMAVHMKDFKREGSTWPALLEGDVDFHAVMAELRAIGYGGPMVSEVDPEAATYKSTADTIRTIIDTY